MLGGLDCKNCREPCKLTPTNPCAVFGRGQPFRVESAIRQGNEIGSRPAEALACVANGGTVEMRGQLNLIGRRANIWFVVAGDASGGLDDMAASCGGAQVLPRW